MLVSACLLSENLNLMVEMMQMPNLLLEFRMNQNNRFGTQATYKIAIMMKTGISIQISKNQGNFCPMNQPIKISISNIGIRIRQPGINRVFQ